MFGVVYVSCVCVLGVRCVSRVLCLVCVVFRACCDSACFVFRVSCVYGEVYEIVYVIHVFLLHLFFLSSTSMRITNRSMPYPCQQYPYKESMGIYSPSHNCTP